MRKAYSTILLFLGIGIVGLLFAQKSEDSDPENKQVKKPEPDINVHVQKELDEKGNIQRLDSSYSWRWSYQDDLPEHMQERLQEFFKDFSQDFSFHFNDSIFFPDGIQKFFDQDFQRIFEDIPWESDSFDEKFQQKFQEKLENLNDMEFRFNWDENFKKDLEERFKEMEERMKELYQRQIQHRGKAI